MSAEEFAVEKGNARTRMKKAEISEEYIVESLKNYIDKSASQLYDWLLERQGGVALPFKERN